MKNRKPLTAEQREKKYAYDRQWRKSHKGYARAYRTQWLAAHPDYLRSWRERKREEKTKVLADAIDALEALKKTEEKPS